MRKWEEYQQQNRPTTEATRSVQWNSISEASRKPAAGCRAEITLERLASAVRFALATAQIQLQTKGWDEYRPVGSVQR